MDENITNKTFCSLSFSFSLIYSSVCYYICRVPYSVVYTCSHMPFYLTFFSVCFRLWDTKVSNFFCLYANYFINPNTTFYFLFFSLIYFVPSFSHFLSHFFLLPHFKKMDFFNTLFSVN